MVCQNVKILTLRICFAFFKIGIHFTQGFTATTRHGVTRKRVTAYRD